MEEYGKTEGLNNVDICLEKLGQKQMGKWAEATCCLNANDQAAVWTPTPRQQACLIGSFPSFAVQFFPQMYCQ